MTSVLVVGAGLAGLTVGRTLAQHGLDVTVLEATGRAGGKAGSDLENGRLREHGYHIFPGWYLNTRALLDELGVQLNDINQWHYIRPGAFERPVTFKVPDTPMAFLDDLRDGLLPWPDTLLYWYFVLDALGEPLSHAAFLDRISRIGLMRSRWYATDALATLEGENILKATAIPAYEISAMTAKLITAYWARTPRPFMSVLRDDLQTAFIDPFVTAVESAGAKLHFGTSIASLRTSDGKISAVVTTNGAEHTADYYVMTTPLEVTRTLIGADVQRLDPDLGSFEHLEASPMAAFHVSLNRTLDHVKREHMFLLGSRYETSFIDVSQHWDIGANTELSFISSNFIPLRDLSEDDQVDMLFEEVKRYIPIDESDIADRCMRPNTTVPLFINTVASWPNRPEVRSERIPNLFFAGDWVRSAIDVACMEGAIASAMECARQIGAQAGIQEIPSPQAPPKYPEWLLRLGTWLLAPAAAGVWAYAKIRGRRTSDE